MLSDLFETPSVKWDVSGAAEGLEKQRCHYLLMAVVTSHIKVPLRSSICLKNFPDLSVLATAELA